MYINKFKFFIIKTGFPENIDCLGYGNDRIEK